MGAGRDRIMEGAAQTLRGFSCGFTGNGVG
nr:MAG TPA: hypothetical protein [Caudoviricetes sp.]